MERRFPSPEQINSSRRNAQSLRSWGVPSPPPTHWRRTLVQLHRAQQENRPYELPEWYLTEGQAQGDQLPLFPENRWPARQDGRMEQPPQPSETRASLEDLFVAGMNLVPCSAGPWHLRSHRTLPVPTARRCTRGSSRSQKR